MPDRRLDFVCECGTECRVLVDVPPGGGSSAAEFVRHCDQGRVWTVPGKPVRFFEKKEGEWKQVPRW
jgi:hypothetical protein